MEKQNEIVADNGDGTFGVQEYCAGCGCDMGVRMYESIEMATRSVDGTAKIYCGCPCISPPSAHGIPTKKELGAHRISGRVL